MVRKINLHKRIAEVEIEFMEQGQRIYLGIGMLEKENQRKSNKNLRRF